MSAEKSSFECSGGMGVESNAKLMSSTQAVGLLALLVDAGNFTLRTFDKQELWQHILAAHSTPSLPLVQDITHELSVQAPAGQSRVVVKKVRFAPDVVEPAGDSRAYRGKNGANTMVKKQVDAVRQGHKEGQHDTGVSLNDEVLKVSQANSGCKAQASAKPYLPANRMLLYRGKQLSRSMMTLDFTA